MIRGPISLVKRCALPNCEHTHADSVGDLPVGMFMPIQSNQRYCCAAHRHAGNNLKRKPIRLDVKTGVNVRRWARSIDQALGDAGIPDPDSDEGLLSGDDSR